MTRHSLHKSTHLALCICIGLFVWLCFAPQMAWAQSQASASSSTKASSKANAPKPDPLLLGNQSYEKGDYQAAAEHYRQAAREGRNALQRAFAWFNLGNCHVQLKANHKAIVAYRRSIEVAPTFSRAWSLLGDLYWIQGSIGDAIAAWHRVLENEGQDFHAHQMLGEAALKGGDVTTALRHFDAAQKIEPEIADIYLAQADALAQIRDYEAAQKLMEQALLRLAKPPADAFFYLGELYELSGETRRAIRTYEEGLSYNPKRKNYWFRVANLHERNGDDFLSLLTMEQAIQAGLNDSELHIRRGVIFFRQQRYEKALDEYRKALSLGSPQGRRGMENVAAAYSNTGNKKKSEEIQNAIRNMNK